MKLLVDENLSPDLALKVADLFPESIHVGDAGLSATADARIWEYGKQNGFALSTKDRMLVSAPFGQRLRISLTDLQFSI